MQLRAADLPAALEAVLAKYRSLIPSIALLIHLADGGCGPVPLSALDKAVGWGQYLFAHALHTARSRRWKTSDSPSYSTGYSSGAGR